MISRKKVLSALAALTFAIPFSVSGGAFDEMYVIGDSLSDQSNLFYATESLTGTGIPAADHYWEGRFANGEIWAGVLADRINISLEASLVNGGTNFADGGARTDYNRVEDDFSKPFPVNYLCHNGTQGPNSCDYGSPPYFGLPEDAFPWTLDAQVDEFASRGVWDPDGLYVVFAGANDLSDLISMYARCKLGISLFCDGRGNPETTIPIMINGISDAIAAFVAAGARDILVPNMPNLGEIPAIPSELSFLATGLSEQYNQAFEVMLAGWEASGVNIIRYDTFQLITDVVADPEAFGFTNASEPCYEGFVLPNPGAQECNDPDAYVFWDIEHPTAAFHTFMADQILVTITLDILDDLDNQVSNLNANIGLKNSLNDKLDSAMQLLTDDNSKNDGAAVSKLQEFIKMVQNRQGKHISVELGDALIKRSEQILALLEA